MAGRPVVGAPPFSIFPTRKKRKCLSAKRNSVFILMATVRVTELFWKRRGKTWMATPRRRKPFTRTTETIYADDEKDGPEWYADEMPDGWVGKVARELRAGKRQFSFLWIDERFSDESNGIFNVPAKGTFYFIKIHEIHRGLTDEEKSKIIRSKSDADRAFAALYPGHAAKVAEAVKGKKAQGNHRLLYFFTTEHLPEDLRPIGNVFVAVAEALEGLVPDGPERTVALRKLLESKDAAVRAVKYPGN